MRTSTRSDKISGQQSADPSQHAAGDGGHDQDGGERSQQGWVVVADHLIDHHQGPQREHRLEQLGGEGREHGHAQQPRIPHEGAEEPVESEPLIDLPFGPSLAHHQQIGAFRNQLLQLLDAEPAQSFPGIADQHPASPAGHEQQHENPIQIQQGRGFQAGQIPGPGPQRAGIEAEGLQLKPQLGQLQGPQALLHILQILADEIPGEGQLAGGGQVHDAGQRLLHPAAGTALESAGIGGGHAGPESACLIHAEPEIAVPVPPPDRWPPAALPQARGLG